MRVTLYAVLIYIFEVHTTVGKFRLVLGQGVYDQMMCSRHVIICT